ncbi:DnaJ domain-containing protein [Methanoplanus sp. FWC-SCC4]|uniref:DnaJ domain-containing protein n=1 Tax=Methanochimaera problematica TaxID=2609417 RepID=A0AA97FCU4_9EURY|nr:DnaJ domain-containing protein [Methanoplanus sp. FWC-SCC4]WOF16702.1 DnaJ domain-containing protein [Methanoplanus sp. FWC-SCC4]
MLWDYYKTLGLKITATDEDIKKAYRSLAKAYHPDTSTHPNAAEQFRLITIAYETLSGPDTKSEYDKKLKGSQESYTKSETHKEDKKDEYSLMADYEFTVREKERFLIDGEELVLKNTRHLLIKDTEYIVYNDGLINIGGIHRFKNSGTERYLIDGTEYILENAEHYYQKGEEFILINGIPYKIKSSD